LFLTGTENKRDELKQLDLHTLTTAVANCKAIIEKMAGKRNFVKASNFGPHGLFSRIAIIETRPREK
jgi:hypothetical protein